MRITCSARLEGLAELAELADGRVCLAQRGEAGNRSLRVMALGATGRKGDLSPPPTPPSPPSPPFPRKAPHHHSPDPMCILLHSTVLAIMAGWNALFVHLPPRCTSRDLCPGTHASPIHPHSVAQVGKSDVAACNVVLALICISVPHMDGAPLSLPLSAHIGEANPCLQHF